MGPSPRWTSKPGELAGDGRGKPPSCCSDLSTLVVEINLDETDVAQVHVGQEAS